MAQKRVRDLVRGSTPQESFLMGRTSILLGWSE
jgi:hypothetical protein